VQPRVRGAPPVRDVSEQAREAEEQATHVLQTNPQGQAQGQPKAAQILHQTRSYLRYSTHQPHSELCARPVAHVAEGLHHHFASPYRPYTYRPYNVGPSYIREYAV
jgi:hypothetical protein